MGKFVAENYLVKVSGVDLSDHAHTLTITDSANKVDVTAFGGNGYTQYLQGLKDAQITVDFYSDFAASSVHSTLQPLYASGGTFMFEFRADSTNPVSATNPRGSMIASLYDYVGLTGQVGAASMFTATFQNAVNGITWGTVP